MKKGILFITLALFLHGCGQKNEKNMNNNPFLVEWDTPYGVPPFDKIKPEHFIPAFQEGIKIQKEEIDAIINSPDAPTFENTIEAFEYSGLLLDKVANTFFNLTACLNSAEIMELAGKIIPEVTRHGDDVSLNAKLFERIKRVYDQKEDLGLTGEKARLLEQTYQGFVRRGANVPEDKQARFREINEKLAVFGQQFSNNVLNATNGYKLIVDDVNRLNGLSSDQISAASEAANADPSTNGKWVFTIHMPSMEPFLMNCHDRELREELWRAYSSRCIAGEFDNRAIIDSIVNLELERANILGFKSYADYALDDRMAKTPEAVNELLMSIWTPALNKAKGELAEYHNMIKAGGNNFSLQPWDWRYYAEKSRKEKYDLDEDIVRPYFSLENVRDGIFMICDSLYGISFKRNLNLPIYEESVEGYEVIDNGNVIAILYLDYFPRESKRSGAWMTNYREQYIDQTGNNVIPIVSLVCNFTKPTAGKPALLNIDQTETFFHEFGHGLHSMLSKCHYRSLSGTSVARDFVELPSQIFEHWASEPKVMKLYAKHYKTGEAIPDSLIEKIGNAATYGQGFANTELIAASLLDMNYFSITTPTSITLPQYEDQLLKNIGLIPEIISRYKSPYFLHIFGGGYNAGYYSYTWSAVLDNDAFDAFKEKGVFNKEVANSFRRNILERGNSDDPLTLYIAFRGRTPSIEPLLKNRGLK